MRRGTRKTLRRDRTCPRTVLGTDTDTPRNASEVSSLIIASGLATSTDYGLSIYSTVKGPSTVQAVPFTPHTMVDHLPTAMFNAPPQGQALVALLHLTASKSCNAFSCIP